MSVRWLRPRYSAMPNPFHAATRAGGSYQTACNGRWPQSELTDCLEADGTGSGEYATRKCGACVEIVKAASVDVDRAEGD